MAKRRSRTERATREAAKRHPKVFLTILILLVIVIAVCACLYFFVFKEEVDNFLHGLKDPSDSVHSGGADLVDGDLKEISSADLSIHFLELGNKYTGDCTLIKVGDTEVLIDAGSRKDSAGAIADYVGQYCSDNKIEYVIATHAHQDHIAGFVALQVRRVCSSALISVRSLISR